MAIGPSVPACHTSKYDVVAPAAKIEKTKLLAGPIAIGN